MGGYKEKMRESLLKKVRAAGLCDERGAAFCASSSNGLVLLAVKGNMLTISECDMQHNIGRCLHSIPLAEITSLTVKGGFLSVLMGGEALSFRYKNKKFAFHNVVITGGVKDSVNVIREEANA